MWDVLEGITETGLDLTEVTTEHPELSLDNSTMLPTKELSDTLKDKLEEANTSDSESTWSIAHNRTWCTVCLEEPIENCKLKLSRLKLTEEDIQENYSDVKTDQPNISKYNRVKVITPQVSHKLTSLSSWSPFFKPNLVLSPSPWSWSCSIPLKQALYLFPLASFMCIKTSC